MKRAFFLLPFLLVGCGGGGGGSSDPVDQWINQALSAFEREDLATLTSMISSSYFNDCETKNDLVANYNVLFSQANSIDITDSEIKSKVVNNDTGFALVTVEYKARLEMDNGTFLETFTDVLVLRRENGVWKDYGNQGC